MITINYKLEKQNRQYFNNGSTDTMERKISAKKRDGNGSNLAGRLRREGRIPANLIGGGKAEGISVDEKDFGKLLNGGLRQSIPIDLDVDGSVFRVVAKDLQRHPVTGRVLHIDFYKVINGQKLKVAVGIELNGLSRGVKAGGALEQYISTLKVRTVPENLQEKIEVDITPLEVGAAVHLSDLNLPESWEVILRGDPIICRIARSRMTTLTDQAGEKEGAESK